MSKSYLALGDSYTIGEAVSQSDSFPFQLVSKLNSEGHGFAEPDVIAVTGWTTSNLISGIKKAAINSKFDLVSLLIGVNNQYQGLPPERFRDEFKKLLAIAVGFSRFGNQTVFVISIPDWGQTPFGKSRDSETVSSEIDLFNRICKEESKVCGVRFIDITPISRKASADLTLTANDGLHPSVKMYGEWVTLITASLSKL